MYETPDFLGPSVSPQGDPRVTTVGRVLRRFKLNEFSQFLNVLKGEMTLVGLRPETPDLAAAYPLEANKIFSVKPGLVGMRVLILGGDGYLGWPKAMFFSSRGHEVAGVDNYFRCRACTELNREPLFPVPNQHERAAHWEALKGNEGRRRLFEAIKERYPKFTQVSLTNYIRGQRIPELQIAQIISEVTGIPIFLLNFR
jgi:hypothetical protein